jgi:hypothetical protein
LESTTAEAEIIKVWERNASVAAATAERKEQQAMWICQYVFLSMLENCLKTQENNF